MSDKIKAARSRAQSNGPYKKKKEDQASWFEKHVIVMGTVMGNAKEQEAKIKQALEARMSNKVRRLSWDIMVILNNSRVVSFKETEVTKVKP